VESEIEIKREWEDDKEREKNEVLSMLIMNEDRRNRIIWNVYYIISLLLIILNPPLNGS